MGGGVVRVLLLLVVSWLAFPVQGAVEVHRFDDPVLEERYKTLIEELRCLVCQNQNLADSNAELAQDLRAKTYEMVVAGATEEQVGDFMVGRYGDFVLYRPPVKSTTALLWVGPFVILLVGLIVVVRLVMRRREPVPELAEADVERARRLLDDEAGDKG